MVVEHVTSKNLPVEGKVVDIKTCAYNNRFALKCAFGESYNELYPGTIYSPPSYDVRFPSAIMSS